MTVVRKWFATWRANLIDSFFEINPQLSKQSWVGAIFMLLTEFVKNRTLCQRNLGQRSTNVIISMAGDGALLVRTLTANQSKGVKNFSRSWRFYGSWFLREVRNDRDVIEASNGSGLWNSDHFQMFGNRIILKETYEKVEVEKLWKFKTF